MEPDRGKPPVSRLLSVGARGAERVAHVAGVDRAVDQAVEEAVVRALRSPAIRRALERAVQETAAANAADEAADLTLLVRRTLESDAADQIWAEVLASEQFQQLVERIASAPEIRTAIAAQSAGLITDLGVRLTKVTEALDDAMERVVRRGHTETETNQAGLATRLVAGGIDLALLFGAYSLASGVLASVANFLFGHNPSPVAVVVLGLAGFVAAGAIVAAFWALIGQTPGMRFLSIRLTQNGSREVTGGCAVRRVFAMALSIIPLGLGFLAILRDPQRRAWHDRLTGTEVIYDLQARSARHATATARARQPVQPARPS